jgi:hypothetical protein
MLKTTTTTNTNIYHPNMAIDASPAERLPARTALVLPPVVPIPTHTLQSTVLLMLLFDLFRLCHCYGSSSSVGIFGWTGSKSADPWRLISARQHESWGAPVRRMCRRRTTLPRHPPASVTFLICCYPGPPGSIINLPRFFLL